MHYVWLCGQSASARRASVWVVVETEEGSAVIVAFVGFNNEKLLSVKCVLLCVSAAWGLPQCLPAALENKRGL